MSILNRETLGAVWPIWLGYIPLGLAAGVLSEQVGLEAWEIGVMSILVFAGSGQFIALSMMGSVAPSIATIVLTTFIVNLRHLLYSSTLVPYLRGESRAFLAAFAQGIVDETFAVNNNHFLLDKRWTPQKALVASYLAWGCWIAATVAGNVLGSLVVIDTALVGYTLTAMFIGLWSFHWGDLRLVVIGLLGGVIALILSLFLDYKLHIVLATILAATAGCIWESRGKS